MNNDLFKDFLVSLHLVFGWNDFICLFSVASFPFISSDEIDRASLFYRWYACNI